MSPEEGAGVRFL